MKRLLMLLLCAGLASTVHAEETPGGCVEARVDGYKAPDYGCLSQQMGAKAAQKNREAREKPAAAEPDGLVDAGGDQCADGQYVRYGGKAAAAVIWGPARSATPRP